jgi:hypothetical protein
MTSGVQLDPSAVAFPENGRFFIEKEVHIKNTVKMISQR